MSGFKPYDASSSGGGGSGGGGGGVFQAEQRILKSYPTGRSGDFATETAPAGKVIKITYLLCNSTSRQSGISLITNGNTLIDNKKLFEVDPSSNSVDEFGISNYARGIDLNDGTPFVMMNEIYCESFTINSSTTTTQVINLSYEIGEVK